MSLIRDVTGYKTSRDYELLFDLMHKSSLVCIVDIQFGENRGVSRDIAQTICKENDYLISARGTGYVWSDSKEDFITQCVGCNLEFIVPNA